jgi:hypothetical protein
MDHVHGLGWAYYSTGYGKCGRDGRGKLVNQGRMKYLEHNSEILKRGTLKVKIYLYKSSKQLLLLHHQRYSKYGQHDQKNGTKEIILSAEFRCRALTHARECRCLCGGTA